MKTKIETAEFLKVPWGPRDVLLLIVAWFGLQLIFGLLLSGMARYVPAVKSFLAAASGGDVGASFVLNLVGVLIGLGIVALYLRKYHAGWSAVGWRRVSVVTTLKYLVGILIVFVLVANVALIVVKLLVPGFNSDQAQTNDFTKAAGSHRSLALIALVLLPPIFEETIFRGFIFPAFSKRAGVVWGAIASSIIFGAAHGQANLFVYTSILGLLLCLMYVRTRSIIPGILLHMANNYLAFLALSGK